MKQVYTNENRLLAFNTRNILENAGIEVKLKNEYVSGSSIPGHQIWLEIWVNEPDYAKAISLLDTTQTEGVLKEWECPKCHEKNSTSFNICWSCQATNEK